MGVKFKPGQSGNPNGRPKKEWTFAGLLREAMEEKNLDGEQVKKAVTRALVDKAIQGDVQALREVANRIDGMPAQSMTLKGDSEEPLMITLSHLAVQKRLEE